jgi:hypothetical protein
MLKLMDIEIAKKINLLKFFNQFNENVLKI